MTKTIDYDKTQDTLFVHMGFRPDEKFKGNIDLGNIVFDVSTKGRVVGVEIVNASEFFKNVGFNPSLLGSITEFSIKSKLTGDYLIVFLGIKAKSVEARIPVPLALRVPA